ncbi:hypothetical protein IDG51_03220 [Pelagibacterales bacterium SAG-MED14]|nr:hypothetical protein [Pelagibacterales bacterium SAG-MED14]
MHSIILIMHSLERFKPVSQKQRAEIKTKNQTFDKLNEVILKQDILILNNKSFSHFKEMNSFVKKLDCKNNKYFLVCYLSLNE